MAGKYIKEAKRVQEEKVLRFFSHKIEKVFKNIFEKSHQFEAGSIGSTGTRYPGLSIEHDGQRREENSVPSSVGSRHRGHLEINYI